jgi:hypothetical protein
VITRRVTGVTLRAFAANGPRNAPMRYFVVMTLIPKTTIPRNASPATTDSAA